MSRSMVLCSTLGFICCLTAGGQSMEFCLTETFRAECRTPNDVIMMEHAMFGRMELGRCVTKNYGHVGCAVDVLRYLDRLCSGRKSCQLTVSDPSLVRTKPCPPDFSAYLEASYRCVAVILSTADDCALNKHVTVPYTVSTAARGGLPSQGYLVNPACPISVNFHVEFGQRLNVTLYDFGRSRQFHHQSSDVTAAGGGNGDGGTMHLLTTSQLAAMTLSGGGTSSSSSSELCRPHFATIVEPTVGGGEVRLCGDRSQRETHVYLSISNQIRIKFPATDLTNRFIMKFEVIGCPEYRPLSRDYQIRYEINRLVVICNTTGHHSELICDGNVWKGQLHNCTSPTAAVPAWRAGMTLPEDRITFPPIDVSAMIVCGVALIVIVYVASTIVCAIYINRRRRICRKSASMRPLDDVTADNNASIDIDGSYCRNASSHVARKGQWHQLRQTVTSPIDEMMTSSLTWRQSPEPAKVPPEAHCQYCECSAGSCSSSSRHCDVIDIHRTATIFSVSNDAV